MVTKKSLPKSIKILDSIYTVKYVNSTKKVNPSGKEELDGLLNPSSQTITLYLNKHSMDQVWQTLWHELLHAVVGKMWIQEIEKSKNEERIIDLLALGVSSIIAENDFSSFTKVIKETKKAK